jgi:hypothetical protein
MRSLLEQQIDQQTICLLACEIMRHEALSLFAVMGIGFMM